MSPPKTWNFLIVYRGREGSTAISNTLGKQEGIHVPIAHEDMDLRYFKLNHKQKTDIYRELENVFRTGVYKYRRTKDLGTRPDATKSTGFKWRPFGSKIILGHICRRNNVKVFRLSRRSFREIVCSAYIHTIKADADGPEFAAHPQFSVRSAKGAAKDKLLEQYRNRNFELDKKYFLKIARGQAKSKLLQSLNINRMRLGGARIKSIYYEDFCDNSEAFIAGFLTEIGVELPNKIDTESDYSKVYDTPHSSRIHGVEKAFTGWQFKILEQIYRLNC